MMQFKDYHTQKDHIWQPKLNLGKKEKVISYNNIAQATVFIQILQTAVYNNTENRMWE